MIETRIGICRIGGDNKSFARRRKRLAKGKELFLGRVLASRRTCAHNDESALGLGAGTRQGVAQTG